MAQDESELSAGTLEPEEAYATSLFPAALLADTDAVLSGFEQELRWPAPPSDDRVFGVIERVVRDLNRVNSAHGGVAYETGEREQLCAYIDASLTEAGVDVEALAARRGIRRWEITDEWRHW